MDYKQLKKLADICRKAGIKHFKNSEIEFTLNDYIPVDTKSKKSIASGPVIDASFKAEGLSDEALLFYSAVDAAEDLKV